MGPLCFGKRNDIANRVGASQQHDQPVEAERNAAAAAVTQAVERVAADITRVLGTDNPLVLTVMGGAVVFSGQLLPRLRFPLDCDYLHVTRYGDAIPRRGATPGRTLASARRTRCWSKS